MLEDFRRIYIYIYSEDFRDNNIMMAKIYENQFSIPFRNERIYFSYIKRAPEKLISIGYEPCGCECVHTALLLQYARPIRIPFI